MISELSYCCTKSLKIPNNLYMLFFFLAQLFPLEIKTIGNNVCENRQSAHTHRNYQLSANHSEKNIRRTEKEMVEMVQEKELSGNHTILQPYLLYDFNMTVIEK